MVGTLTHTRARGSGHTGEKSFYTISVNNSFAACEHTHKHTHTQAHTHTHTHTRTHTHTHTHTHMHTHTRTRTHARRAQQRPAQGRLCYMDVPTLMCLHGSMMVLMHLYLLGMCMYLLGMCLYSMHLIQGYIRCYMHACVLSLNTPTTT